jgi:hypothetical protein
MPSSHNTPQKIFSRRKAITAIAERRKDTPMVTQNANGESPNGKGTFIPSVLLTSVGSMRTIVIVARNFMTELTLFEMIDANASIIPFRMLL